MNFAPPCLRSFQFADAPVCLAEFTGFMDLVQRALSAHTFAHVRLDGSLPQKQRAAVVSSFTSSKQPCILVASLKAGGVGLNLIAATRVYVMDLWWNAAVESQAVDRIHRFGQTREVYVTRFLGESTYPLPQIESWLTPWSFSVCSGQLDRRQDGQAAAAQDCGRQQRARRRGRQEGEQTAAGGLGVDFRGRVKRGGGLV